MLLRSKYFSFFTFNQKSGSGFTEFLWSFVKFSTIKAACHREHGHAGWPACSALRCKQCAISSDQKETCED